MDVTAARATASDLYRARPRTYRLSALVTLMQLHALRAQRAENVGRVRHVPEGMRNITSALAAGPGGGAGGVACCCQAAGWARAPGGGQAPMLASASRVARP